MVDSPKPSLKIVDISGYSFTGKSAVYDLLCEFEGYFSHSKEFEFDLLRIQGGILDLQSALTENWSPIRSSEAIRNFYRLIHTIGGNGSLASRFTSSGSHYDRFFPGFSDLSHQYVDSLVTASWKCEWPFAFYNHDRVMVLAKKVANRLGLMKEEEIYLARLSQEEFLRKTKEYLKGLFAGIPAAPLRGLILNNCFEPFFPERSLIFFDNARSIVVDRDPRDIYLSALQAGKIAGSHAGRAVTGGGVHPFIERFRVYREGMGAEMPNVYRTHFEKVILDYDVEVDKIRGFLSESIGDYPGKGSVFKPAVSSKNIRLWKAELDSSLRKDVEIIQSELAAYCLDI